MMKLFYCALFYLLFTTAAVAVEDLSEILYHSHKAQALVPLLSQRQSKQERTEQNQNDQNQSEQTQKGQKQANISDTQAYSIQRAYVALRLKADTISGYKAGLTSIAGQKKFGVKSALSGILFSSGHINPKMAIELGRFQKLMLETEIGFVLGKPISKVIADVPQLQAHIKAIMPVIELPDLGYVNPTQIKGIDLIASNVASSAYLLGTPQIYPNALNLNALQPTIKHKGQVISAGKGSDALGDQWQALLWLVNQLVAQGYQLEVDQFLITGALGKMLPALPGEYQADFGSLGNIRFNVTQ